jgi:hypothetical protein
MPRGSLQPEAMTGATTRSIRNIREHPIPSHQNRPVHRLHHPPPVSPTNAPTLEKNRLMPDPVNDCLAITADLVTQANALTCYEHCLDQGAGDIHRLDLDWSSTDTLAQRRIR